MEFSNLSTLNASIVVKIGSIVVPIDNFDPDSDIFTVNDRQTADGEVTPDGYFNAWAMRTPIETSFNVTGASRGGKVLQGLLNAQANGVLNSASIVVKNNDFVATYGPGVLTSAKPSQHLGNQKVLPTTFNFKFGNIL